VADSIQIVPGSRSDHVALTTEANPSGARARHHSSGKVEPRAQLDESHRGTPMPFVGRGVTNVSFICPGIRVIPAQLHTPRAMYDLTTISREIAVESYWDAMADPVPMEL
jgi:hypothetical protein